MPPAPGKVRPHRGRYRVGYLLEEVSNNATAQMIGCLGPRFQGRESPKTERGHLGGAGVTASATIRLTHVATQTRTYMRPPRRAQPTRRLPRVHTHTAPCVSVFGILLPRFSLPPPPYAANRSPRLTAARAQTAPEGWRGTACDTCRNADPSWASATRHTGCHFRRLIRRAARGQDGNA